jgi:hypothetical protein
MQHEGAKVSDAIMDRFAEEIEENIAIKRKEREIEGSGSSYLPNLWLDFVGWDEHLKKFKRSELLEMTELSKEKDGGERAEEQEQEQEQEQEDRGLAQACVASQRLIRRAMATCQPSMVGRSALEFVNRREVREGKNKKPFYAKHKANTIRKYTAIWVKMLRYIWKSSSKAEKDRPSYRLKRQQEQGLKRIKQLTRRWKEDRGSQPIPSQETSQETS